MIPEHLRERCIALAWIHDVWEDSDCGTAEILALDATRRMVKYMNYITHGKNEVRAAKRTTGTTGARARKTPGSR